jgi:hypothetical protein
MDWNPTIWINGQYAPLTTEIADRLARGKTGIIDEETGAVHTHKLSGSCMILYEQAKLDGFLMLPSSYEEGEGLSHAWSLWTEACCCPNIRVARQQEHGEEWSIVMCDDAFHIDQELDLDEKEISDSKGPLAILQSMPWVDGFMQECTRTLAPFAFHKRVRTGVEPYVWLACTVVGLANAREAARILAKKSRAAIITARQKSTELPVGQARPKEPKRNSYIINGQRQPLTPLLANEIALGRASLTWLSYSEPHYYTVTKKLWPRYEQAKLDGYVILPDRTKSSGRLMRASMLWLESIHSPCVYTQKIIRTKHGEKWQVVMNNWAFSVDEGTLSVLRTDAWMEYCWKQYETLLKERAIDGMIFGDHLPYSVVWVYVYGLEDAKTYARILVNMGRVAFQCALQGYTEPPKSLGFY